MNLDESTIDDSDSEFLNKQLTLLHRLKWRPHNQEQLFRYQKEFLTACAFNYLVEPHKLKLKIVNFKQERTWIKANLSLDAFVYVVIPDSSTINRSSYQEL
jgi:hypothetical protein